MKYVILKKLVLNIFCKRILLAPKMNTVIIITLCTLTQHIDGANYQAAWAEISATGQNQQGMPEGLDVDEHSFRTYSEVKRQHLLHSFNWTMVWVICFQYVQSLKQEEEKVAPDEGQLQREAELWSDEHSRTSHLTEDGASHQTENLHNGKFTAAKKADVSDISQVNSKICFSICVQ